MITLLIVDDHALVRTGLKRMLSDVDTFQVVGEATSGEQAIRLARELKPDVILMDIKMPGIGGIEAIKRISQQYDRTKIIAVTAITDDIYPERVMKAGASGYLTKDAGFEEVVKAIQSVRLDIPYMSASVAQQLALRSCGRFKNTASPFTELSERELQTAILIASGVKPQAVANAFNISPKTVNTYRYRIFEKLNVQNDVELTVLAVKFKIVDVDID